MSDERKVFWAFAWLCLFIVGLSLAAKQLGVIVVVVQGQTLNTETLRAPQRPRLGQPLIYPFRGKTDAAEIGHVETTAGGRSSGGTLPAARGANFPR
jgi:hypothetical protein